MPRDYVECVECGFFVAAAEGPTPSPLNWEACPDCGGEVFQFRED